MRSEYRVILVLVAMLALCACSTTPTALESQTGVQNQRHARLYFLRQKGYYGTHAVAELQVNGQVIGAVANGSYIFVDRPAGTYTLRVEPKPIVLGFFETEVQVAEGRSYYFEVGPRHYAPVERVLLPALAGNVGQPIQGRGFNAGWTFNALDPTTGAAEVAKLKTGGAR